MSIKHLLVSLLTLSVVNIATAQDSLEFKPSGKVLATAFFDYSAGLNKDTKSGFDLTRAVIGYQYQFTRQIYIKATLDGAAGRTANDDLKPYMRNAYISWSDHGLTIEGGLVGTTMFKEQENFWGYRYMLKAYQDEYSFASSCDIGLVAKYKFNKLISADISILNGEGYKKIRKDNSMRYALGVSIKPTDNIVLRAYTDIYNKEKRQEDNTVTVPMHDEYNIGLFGGYRNTRFSLAAEYNRQFNASHLDGQDMYGWSVYSTVNIVSKWKAFIRYDLLKSTDNEESTANWNNDRQMTMIGVEFKPYKFITIAPNFRNINYTSRPSEQYIFLSAGFNL